MAFKPYCASCNTWHTEDEGHRVKKTNSPVFMLPAVPGSQIFWPHVYAPFNNTWYGQRQEFQMAVKTDALWTPEDLEAGCVLYFAHKGVLRAKSQIRPEVECANGIDVLAEQLQRLDARNLPRDHIFKMADGVELFVEVFHCDGRGPHHGMHFYGLGLVKVRVTL